MHWWAKIPLGEDSKFTLQKGKRVYRYFSGTSDARIVGRRSRDRSCKLEFKPSRREDVRGARDKAILNFLGNKSEAVGQLTVIYARSWCKQRDELQTGNFANEYWSWVDGELELSRDWLSKLCLGNLSQVLDAWGKGKRSLWFCL